MHKKCQYILKETCETKNIITYTHSIKHYLRI